MTCSNFGISPDGSNNLESKSNPFELMEDQIRLDNAYHSPKVKVKDIEVTVSYEDGSYEVYTYSKNSDDKYSLVSIAAGFKECEK